ncbi:hypothetical protein LR48_Vigan08g073000 [Vigna angularis]|uniref:Uncharacterized protein n=1 Tax=Phaseolus angularis TaxID=3914 RepID=A0A0L9V4H3_PHAAN|nr:hypothetical protein LR48_Vigan08g073000 [Vigna angularis]
MLQAQPLGRAVHVDEVFAQTRVRKGTNQFVDERYRKTHEEFSTRLSQVRSEHESAPTPDDGSNAEDDTRRTQCWVEIVAGKKKGRLYGAGQLAANYTTSRGGTLKHQPSSSTTAPDEVVIRLTQALEQRDQEIIDLRAEFTNFKALVMRVLPETSQDCINYRRLLAFGNYRRLPPFGNFRRLMPFGNYRRLLALGNYRRAEALGNC